MSLPTPYVDYSLVGMPQLPRGCFWEYTEGGRRRSRTYQLPFGFTFTRKTEPPKLRIVTGSVSRNGFSRHTDDVWAVRTTGKSLRAVRRTARRMARENLLNGSLIQPEPVPVPPRIQDVIGPVAAFRKTLGEEH